MKRYEQIAHDIGSMIRRGTLGAGERAPSIREIQRSLGVSLSTVLRAYELLGDRGFVEALPRSGYYVSGLWRSHPEPSDASRPLSTPTAVDAHDVIFQLLDVTRDAAVVPFGSPFPSPTLLPVDRLARCLRATLGASTARLWTEDLAPGSLNLRRYIATRYALSGAAVPADEIVLTSGALEALLLSLSTVTRPGDLVAIESPAFYGCMQAIELLHLKAVEVPTHPAHGMDLGALSRVIAKYPVRACWMMPTFQNPTGALMPDSAKRELARLLARREIPLVEDDAYQELHFGSSKTQAGEGV